MALSEKSRAKMYDYFVTTPLGEEVTSELIASCSTPDLNDLVTKDHLDGRLLELRLELHTQISSLRTEVRDELHSEIGGLRDEMRTMFFWMLGTMVTLIGILAGITVTIH